MTDDRIYSREEFAEILRRAEDFERRAEVALGPQPGFSLSQMREIAAEAGIDPDAVERAAHLLPPMAPQLPIGHTVSGVLRQRMLASFPVVLSAESSAKLLAVIRASTGRLGTGEVTMFGLSWWSDVGGDHVEVRATDEASHVEVSVNRARMLIAPVLLGIMTGWVMVGMLEPITAATFFAGVAAGLGVAGTILGTFISRGKKRSDALMDSIARAMARLESAAPARPAEPDHGVKTNY